jgi:hypothetical protein
MEQRAEARRVTWWLLVIAACGVAITLLWLDTYQQDAGNHYLGARWALKHHENLLDPWNRPLFTWLYALPAQLGWNAARLFTVLIGVGTAWQTWRFARDLGLKQAWLAIPLLWLQPSYFLLSAEVMTEPLHAFVLVCALRLHLRGRIKAGMLVASLLVLCRPEGLFCGLLWGVWILFDTRLSPKFFARLLWSLLLATGGLFWLGLSWAMEGDPLWIFKHWPSNWQQGAYGHGTILGYTFTLPEIIGPLFIPALAAGLWQARSAEAGRTGLRSPAAMWLFIFGLHSILWAWGLMGATGYARFMVTVAPAGAVVLLAGWNALADHFRWRAPWIRGATLAAMFLLDVFYLDAWGYSRDARGIADQWQWWQQHEQRERPVTRLIWSQAYAPIIADRDPVERQPLGDDRAANCAMLRVARPGTLAIWEDETGPAWHKITDADFAAAGFVRLRSERYRLGGVLCGQLEWWLLAPRIVTVHLFYKP